MKKKRIIHLLAISLLLTACDGMRVSEKLDQIDSLIAKEKVDSASIVLNSLNEAVMVPEDQAHYRLLATQLGFITNNPLPSDSLLDLAIIYYNKVNNSQKLADANVYKSYRSRIKQDYPQAILYCKEAERLAMNTNDDRLQFKIVENLAYLNGLCENNLLQLQYAKKALCIAQKVQNKNWIVYSYNKISLAYANLEQYDSAYYYIEKSIPYFKYVYNNQGKAEYLANIGLLYKSNDSKRAKEYFEKALTYGDHPGIYEHLADVYYAEGNKEKAYQLWKKALATNGEYEKGNLIYSILSYNLERGDIEEASNNIDRIITIKDSIINVLRNDTIKDLQLRFDHEVAMHEADKKLINTQRLLMGAAIVLILMAFYIFTRRKKEEAKQKEHQMQLFAYTTEINQLKANKDNALAQIKDLESRNDKDCLRIRELEEDANNAEIAIEKLNKDIKHLLDDCAPKLKQGRMLYDHIIDGGTIKLWSSKEEGLFNKYYAATHYQSYNRLRKVKRATKLSAHNLFYLILKEMDKSDEEVRRIMGLSAEGLRSLRNRTKPQPLEE